MLPFLNTVGPTSAEARTDEERSLQEAASSLPSHTSKINTSDGYKQSAMLFVDEDWYSQREPREARIGNLLWRPVVRFCSTHYKYVKDKDGLRIVQQGIGANEDELGTNFRPPAASKVALSSAKKTVRRSEC